MIVATLSGFLALGVSFTASAKAKKLDNRQTTVNVAFKPSNETALTNYVYDTVTPNATAYHQYLTPSDFAQKFGQSNHYVTTFRKYLNRYHVRAYAYPGNLSLKVQGTKTNVNKAFKAKYVNKGDNLSKTTYRLPNYLSKQIVAVIGLYQPKPAKKRLIKKRLSNQPRRKRQLTLKLKSPTKTMQAVPSRTPICHQMTFQNNMVH